MQRSDFPILSRTINGHQLLYVDNAATTQKPRAVIDAVSEFYAHYNAPVYRGVYSLAEEATQLFEDARCAIANHINARHDHEIVFTRGATEGVNAVALAWAAYTMREGDEIILSELEHHCNLLPWQRLAREKKLVIRFIPIHDDGTLNIDALPELMSSRTKLVSVIHVSNAIGTHVDVARVTRIAHEYGARVLVDAAQSAAHQHLDVQHIDCDFLVFSGHKMMGPTGIGVLYVKHELHDEMQPLLLGGGMVSEVDYHTATYACAPHKFEAGTPPVAQAVGLHAAVHYLTNTISFDDLQRHEAALCTRLIEGLDAISGIRILGPRDQLQRQGHLVSFVHESIHPHDIAAYFDQYGICVRTGHFCAQPLARRLGVESAVRVSFYLYNTLDQVDRIVSTLHQAVRDLTR